MLSGRVQRLRVSTWRAFPAANARSEPKLERSPLAREGSSHINDAHLEKEYELRGLKSADPYSQSAVNEVDPAFADDHGMEGVATPCRG